MTGPVDGRPAELTTLDAVLRGRAGLSPLMIGRAGALTQLRDTFEAAATRSSDPPAVTLIAGEAGIGKTRLLREFVAGLPSGVEVLSAYGDPNGVSRSLSLLADLVPDSLAEAPLPVLAESLRACTGGHRAVLLLEDLHWADADSAWVIDRLVTQAWPGVLVVGTYRPDDLSRRLPGGDLLSRLERRATVERVHLDRLSRNDVTAFLAAVYDEPPPSAVIEALYNRTGGNPFFLEELLTCCGVDRAADLVSVPLPWSLEEVVERQLDGLEPAERRVAEVAAVCGPASRFDLLAEVAGLDETELIGVLRRLIDRGLLVESHGERFLFRHALVRDAVAGALLGRERRRLHERALEALARQDAPVEERARHARGAERYREFVELARAGAEEYMAHGQSFTALRLASDALAEAPDDPVLLAVATRSAWLVGLDDEAADYAAQWMHSAETAGVPEELAAALRWAARIEYDRGHRDTEAALMARVGALVETLSSEERARTLAWMAQNEMLHHRSDSATALADRAIAEADAVGAKAVAAQARIERGSARVISGGDEGRAELLAAVDEAEALEEWVLVARGLNNLFLGVPISSPEGRQLLERFRTATERGGFDGLASSTVGLRLAELAYQEADMEACRRHLDSYRAHWGFRQSDTSTHVRMMQAVLAVEEGRLDDARRLIDELGPMTDDRARLGRLRLAWAAVAGDAVVGRDAAAMTLAAGPGCFAPGGAFGPELVEMVDALLRLGVPAAQVRHDVLDSWSAGHPARSNVESVVEGLLLAEEGRPAEAAARLLTALSAPDPWLPRYLVEYLRIVAAAQVLATGDRRGAHSLVEQAHAGLARWPGWRRDRADALRRRLEGAGPGDGVLSPREREVAVLIAEGLTNAELARRLYISPKTAAVHVSNILMKLDMASRAEVAAWVVRTGLATEVQT